MLRFVPAAIVALSLTPIAAFAQTSTPGIDQHQQNQEQRIDKGISSGALTKPETQRLEQGQNRVNRMESKAKADGTVTKRERAKVHAAQNKQSARIYRQKHDKQRRQP
jgi:hypothetical protein